MEIVSVGLWIAGLFGKTPADATARKIGIATLIVGGAIAVILMVIVGVKMHDAGVIQQHEQAKEAKVATKTLAADRAANDAMANRAVIAEAQNAKLENAMAEAKRTDPEKGQRTVGKVQQSYFDNLPSKGK